MARTLAIRARGMDRMVLVVAVVILGVMEGVSAHVRLDNPVGGLTLVKGQTYTIQWNVNIWHGPGTITLEFSSNDGVNYSEIVSGITALELQDDTYEWTVPDVDSSDCKVKVSYSIYTGTSTAFTVGFPAGGEGEGEGIPASKDNTLYESDSGARSNGGGEDLFVGRTGTLSAIGDLEDLRRAVIEFDIAGNVPSGAVINEVTLTLKVTREPAGAPDSLTKLHKVTSDLGGRNFRREFACGPRGCEYLQ